jgi:hypothetical protein
VVFSVVVVSLVPPEVVVAELPHGVVGLAVTQSHRALTEFKTAMAVLMSQPLMTQSWATLWIIDDEEHWHS